MFLHLGGEVTIPQKEILGIFDYKIAKRSPVSKEFLDLARTDKLLVEIAGPENIKSFIITDNKIFFSPISSTTLQKRALTFLQE